MRHPTDGTLRRLLDEPAGVADADREHVAGCQVCRSELATTREDAGAASAALDVDLPVVVDVDAGWHRLSSAIALDERRRVPAAVTGPRRRRTVRRTPVIAAVGAVALLTGAGAAAAADWLQIFRTERIAPVALGDADLVELPDLSAYGNVEGGDPPSLREVADADAAEEASGLAVPTVEDLPRGVTGDPQFLVASRADLYFFFSAEKAARTAAAAGEELPPPPPGLDGSRFRLSAGPGVAALWSSDHGAPALVIGRAVAPVAESSGVPYETARDYLLSLPGLPEDVASQLRSFTQDGTTLPLPVPTELVATSTADVDGSPATVLTSRDGAMAGVVWVDDGVVTAVAGSLSADEVLSVARGLR